jgi:drug/metabolite transporter (DMT)-like permease
VIVTLALLSAIAFGGGVAFEARAAVEVPAEHAGRPSLLLRLVRRPLWLLGLSANIVGFVLQAAALHRGSLVVVQPLLTTSLLFTLLIISVWTHSPLTRAQWTAIMLIVVGLAIFLGASSPGHPSSGTADAEGWLLCTVAVVTILIVAVVAGLRTTGTTRAALFAVAAGTSDAYMASLAKAFSHSLDHGIWAAFQTWTPYAVAAAGVTALLFISTAYQAGHPTVTLPIITVLDPIVAALIGITLYGEQLRIGGVRGPAVLLAVTGMVTGLIMLSRDDAVAAEVAPDAVTNTGSRLV